MCTGMDVHIRLASHRHKKVFSQVLDSPLDDENVQCFPRTMRDLQYFRTTNVIVRTGIL